MPLKGNYDELKFKLYYPDTGLLIASLDEEAQEDLRANKNMGVYKGALYENFVAEAFLKQGLGLYYYKKEPIPSSMSPLKNPIPFYFTFSPLKIFA